MMITKQFPCQKDAAITCSESGREDAVRCPDAEHWDALGNENLISTQAKGLGGTAAAGNPLNLMGEKEPQPLMDCHLKRVQDKAIDAAKGPNASW